MQFKPYDPHLPRDALIAIGVILAMIMMVATVFAAAPANDSFYISNRTDTVWQINLTDGFTQQTGNHTLINLMWFNGLLSWTNLRDIPHFIIGNYSNNSIYFGGHLPAFYLASSNNITYNYSNMLYDANESKLNVSYSNDSAYLDGHPAGYYVSGGIYPGDIFVNVTGDNMTGDLNIGSGSAEINLSASLGQINVTGGATFGDYVGIGITSPVAPLQIDSQGLGTNAWAAIHSAPNFFAYLRLASGVLGGVPPYNAWDIRTGDAALAGYWGAGDLSIGEGGDGTDFLIQAVTGNVGIEDFNPTSKLSVHGDNASFYSGSNEVNISNGNITASGSIFSQLYWSNITGVPNYVVANNYTNMSNYANYSTWAANIIGGVSGLIPNNLTNESLYLDKHGGAYYLDWSNFANIPAFITGNYTNKAFSLQAGIVTFIELAQNYTGKAMTVQAGSIDFAALAQNYTNETEYFGDHLPSYYAAAGSYVAKAGDTMTGDLNSSAIIASQQGFRAYSGTGYVNITASTGNLVASGKIGIGATPLVTSLDVIGTPALTPIQRIARSQTDSGTGVTTATAYYLQIGGLEYNPGAAPGTPSYRLIGFGYATAGNNPPAYIGYIEMSNSAQTYGDLIFGTRIVTTNTTPTERMRITYDGRVGINDASPAQNLTVHGNASVFYLDSGYVNITAATGSVNVSNDATIGSELVVTGQINASNDVSIDSELVVDGTINVTNDMSIDSELIVDGRVGIGTVSPAGNLHIFTSATIAPAASGDNLIIEDLNADVGISLLTNYNKNQYIMFGSNADADIQYIRAYKNTNSIYFATNTVERFTMDGSGTFTATGSLVAGGMNISNDATIGSELVVTGQINASNDVSIDSELVVDDRIKTVLLNVSNDVSIDSELIVDGNMTVGSTPALFVNVGDKKVGIGTPTPSAALQVAGSGNLVANGFFSTGDFTSWTTSANQGNGAWSINTYYGGYSALYDGDDWGGWMEQNLGEVAGHTYRVIYTLEGGGPAYVTIGGTNGTSRTVAGTYVQDLTAATAADFRVECIVATGDCWFDDFYVYDLSASVPIALSVGAFYVNSAGYLGLNDNSPAQPLTVYGNGVFYSGSGFVNITASTGSLNVSNDATIGSELVVTGQINASNDVSIDSELVVDDRIKTVLLNVSNDMSIDSELIVDGNVGIADMSPASTLVVHGNSSFYLGSNYVNITLDSSGGINYGIKTYTRTTGPASSYGGYFQGTGPGAGIGTGYGVYAISDGTLATNYGIYATASGAATNWAGYFSGDIGITGGIHTNANVYSGTGYVNITATTGVINASGGAYFDGPVYMQTAGMTNTNTTGEVQVTIGVTMPDTTYSILLTPETRLPTTSCTISSKTTTTFIILCSWNDQGFPEIYDGNVDWLVVDY